MRIDLQHILPDIYSYPQDIFFNREESEHFTVRENVIITFQISPSEKTDLKGT